MPARSPTAPSCTATSPTGRSSATTAAATSTRASATRSGSSAWPAGTAAAYECIAAFSATDFRPDLAKIDVPTLVIHGDDDQIVPFEVGGKRSAELVAGAELKVYEGSGHALPDTDRDRLHADLLAFIEADLPPRVPRTNPLEERPHAPTTSTPPDTVVLVHGLWMTPRSWEHWVAHYEAKG